MFNDHKRGKTESKNNISLLGLLTDIAMMAAEEIMKTTTMTIEEAIDVIVSSLQDECRKRIKK